MEKSNQRFQDLSTEGITRDFGDLSPFFALGFVEQLVPEVLESEVAEPRCWLPKFDTPDWSRDV